MKKRRSIRAGFALLLAALLVSGSLPTALAAYYTGDAITFPGLAGTYSVVQYLYEGDYDVYYVNSEGTRLTTVETDSTYGVSIRGVQESFYRDTAGYMYIPDTYRGYPVVRMERADGRNHYLGVRIPATLTEIVDPTFANCPYLEWIEVAPGNTAYYSVDGVLYKGNVNYDRTRLVCYPQRKPDESFTTFAGAQIIDDKAFYFNAFLKHLTIAVGPQGLTVGPIRYCSVLETLIFGEGTLDLSAFTMQECTSLRTVHFSTSYLSAAGGSLSLAFLQASGASGVTVCSVYNTATLSAAARSAGCNYEVCSRDGTDHVLEEQDVELPDQPIPDATVISDVNKYLFTPVYQRDAQGNLVTNEYGTTFLIGYGVLYTRQSYTEPVTLAIPSEYAGKPVLEVQSTLATFTPNLVGVVIPSTVHVIQSGALGSQTLRFVDVDADNAYYKSVDGVLFSADGRTLVSYPYAKETTDYAIAEGTQSLTSPFIWSPNIRRLAIPSTLTDTALCGTLPTLENLERFDVSAENPTYSSDAAGVLFNRTQTKLLRIPPCGPTDYTIPQTVRAMDDRALSSLAALRVLRVADGVTTTPFANLVFAGNLGNDPIRLHIPASVTTIGLSGLKPGVFSICCETSASQAAAFAQSLDNIDFYICNDGHTAWRVIDANDPPVPALGEDNEFTYRLISEESAESFTEYTGVCITGLTVMPDDPFVLSIPDACCGLPVRSVDLSGWSIADCRKIRGVELSATVETCDLASLSNAATRFSNLETITVDPDSAYLCSVDDVLFDKAMTTLLFYPAQKTDESYAIPEGVVTFASASVFGSNDHLRQLTIPASFACAEALMLNTMRSLPELERITVHPENEAFANDAYGVLFNADMTTLIIYPPCAAEEMYTIPTSVESLLSTYSFSVVQNLKVLRIADGATTTPAGRITSVTGNLEYIHIPSSVTEVRFSFIRNTIIICSDCADCAAAAFAEQDKNPFMVCTHAGEQPVDPPDDPPVDPDDPPVQPDAPVVMTVSGASAKRGETVRVTVDLTKNEGLIAARLHLQYDPDVLTLTGVEDGGLLGSGTFTAGNDLSAVPYTVLWDDARVRENHTETGTLVTFTFTVADDAPLGETTLTLTYDPNSTFNVELEDVACAITNGSVLVHDRIPGDVDGNSIVSLRDVVLLRRFLAGGWDVTIRTDNADVNADGVLSLKDTTQISRYLAGGWDVTLL